MPRPYISPPSSRRPAVALQYITIYLDRTLYVGTGMLGPIEGDCLMKCGLFRSLGERHDDSAIESLRTPPGGNPCPTPTRTAPASPSPTDCTSTPSPSTGTR